MAAGDKARCSFERMRLGSLMARTFINFWMGLAVCSGEYWALARVPCFAKAMARLFRCATRFWAMAPRGVERLACLLIARTVSTFRSQRANNCSMSVASVRALLSAAMNSSARSNFGPRHWVGSATKGRDILRVRTH